MVLSDVNPKALSYSRVNSAINAVSDTRLHAAPHSAGASLTFLESDLYSKVKGEFDLILANPPFLIDGEKRSYRHGGEEAGAELSLQIVRGALSRLTPGGKLLLYTASAIQDGKDPFINSVYKILLEPFDKFELSYEEIDPDIFGEELGRQAYSEVDRLAAVGLVVTRPKVSV